MQKILQKLKRYLTRHHQHGNMNSYVHHGKHSRHRRADSAMAHNCECMRHEGRGGWRRQQLYDNIYGLGPYEIRKIEEGSDVVKQQSGASQHCDLCDKHCPLHAPSCPKGAARVQV